VKRAVACAAVVVAACTREVPPAVALPITLPTPPPIASDAPRATIAPSSDETTYASDRGIVRLVADGTIVGGSYNDGVLACAVRGDVIACDWFESGATGRATFHRKNGGKLEGTYGNDQSDDDIGTWNLEPLPQSSLATLDGAWDTNWGLATMHEVQGGVHVDYRDGKMDCTRTGSELACTWTEGGSNGDANFKIESPHLLRGTWTTSGSGPVGAWAFVRR